MAVNLLDYPFDAAALLQKKRAIRREEDYARSTRYR